MDGASLQSLGLFKPCTIQCVPDSVAWNVKGLGGGSFCSELGMDSRVTVGVDVTGVIRGADFLRGVLFGRSRGPLDAVNDLPSCGLFDVFALNTNGSSI